MADTGSTSYADAADKIGTSHPNITRRTISCLRRADALMPYMFDASEAYVADATNYPGGNVKSLLSAAILSTVWCGK